MSYASRNLSEVERRYAQTEKEALAVVWACKQFNVFMSGREFELETDHKPLECSSARRRNHPQELKDGPCDYSVMTTRLLTVPGKQSLQMRCRELISAI